MTDITVRTARPEDAAQLNTALRGLSEELGDAHGASDEDILRCGFGEKPVFRAQLAERDGASVGCALYSPLYSTIRAAPGLFVSDLWIAPDARGLGLGRRLLAAAARDADEAWGARFLKLTVYDDNHPAQAFYHRLGFRHDRRDQPQTLDGAALDALRGSS